MRKINFVAVPNKKRYKMTDPWFFYMPKSESVLEFTKKAVRSLNYYMYSVRRDRTTMLTSCRMWKTSDKEWSDLEGIDR